MGRNTRAVRVRSQCTRVARQTGKGGGAAPSPGGQLPGSGIHRPDAAAAKVGDIQGAAVRAERQTGSACHPAQHLATVRAAGSYTYTQPVAVCASSSVRRALSSPFSAPAAAATAKYTLPAGLTSTADTAPSGAPSSWVTTCSTAAPQLSCLARHKVPPAVVSWAAAVTSSVPEGSGINGFTMFLRTIPYNYYALLTVVMSLFLIFTGTDFGSMKLNEDNAKNGDLFTTEDRPYGDDVDDGTAKRLAKIAGVEINTFANEMFEAGEKLDGKTAEEVFLQDFKVFMCGDIRFGVAQGSYMTRKNLLAAEDLLQPYLEEARNKQNVEDIYMLLTDVPKEESVVISSGRYAAEVLADGFETQPADDGSFTLPGVVSRKKQFIPALMTAYQEL